MSQLERKYNYGGNSAYPLQKSIENNRKRPQIAEISFSVSKSGQGIE